MSREFTLAIERFKKKTEKALERAVDRVGARVFRGIVRRTPVLTGRARRGWETYTSRAGARRQVIIFNNVPYIGYLEFGTSRMAPVGMVTLTLAKEQARQSGGTS
jgi:hypothetical protein